MMHWIGYVGSFSTALAAAMSGYYWVFILFVLVTVLLYELTSK